MSRRSDRDDDRSEDHAPRRRPRKPADDGPPRRRGRRIDDDGDDKDRPRRRATGSRGDGDDRARKWARNAPGLGVMALVVGLMALLGSLIPCVGAFAILPAAVIGLPTGIVGLVAARKSRGRAGGGMAIAGLSVSSAAIVIAIIWMVVMSRMGDGSGARPGPAAEDKHAPGAKGQPPIRLTAAELDREFQQDEAGANRKYMDKTVELTGRVTRVEGSRRATDPVVVDLAGANAGRVYFFFDGRLADEPAVGSSVKVRGQCQGKSGAYLTVTHCTLLSVAAAD